MTDPDLHPRRPTIREFLFELITQRLLTLVGLVLLAVAAGVMVGIDVSIPRWLRLGLIVSPLGLLCGHYASKFAIRLLPDPHIVWLVDVDLLDDDGAGLFALPAEDMADLNVTEGQLWAPAPNLRFGKAVDLEEMTVEGTWRGTISDAEMLRALSMVRECRGELEDHAKRGFRIETQAFSIIRNATRQCVRSVVSTFERGSLPDEGNSLGNEIEKAIDDFGLEDQIRHTEVDDADSEAAEDPLSESLQDSGDLDTADRDEPTEVPADD
jgi:hypothetical protein